MGLNCYGKFLALLANIRPRWKGIPRTNILVHYYTVTPMALGSLKFYSAGPWSL